MAKGFSTGSSRRGKVRSVATLVEKSVRTASESRGFAEHRVLTHWTEIAGEQTAAIARPVDVSYSRGGFGATLTLLTTGANAPMLEMQKEELRERVNATYGYNAISRIKVTQTAATGFAEGQVEFRAKPKTPATPDPAVVAQASAAAAPVADQTLREALEALGTNVLTKSRHRAT
ncbi:MAG: DUF721 domain-containing protein [Shimia sp.]